MSAHSEVLSRPELPAHVAVHRRGGGVLVTGPVPGGLVLSGLTEAEATAVIGLGAAVRTPRPVRARSAPSGRWGGVLGMIHRAAERLAPVGPPRSRVVVLGEGPLPHEIRRSLGPIVRRVVPEAEAQAALHADAAIHPPDLVILPAIDAVTALAGRPWQARGVPQLPIVVSGDLLSVGPLVRPGTGPCLDCLDRHRGARDPEWASWLAFRAGAPENDRDLDTAPELRAAAAALAAWIVSGHQSDRALPAGVSLSMQRPHPRVHHHLWTRHPSCCGSDDARVTMDA